MEHLIGRVDYRSAKTTGLRQRMEPADLPYAPTAFGDQDAGSGPVHASPGLGPMTAALHNISARHLHEIGAALPDDRQFLRAWRRNLQECQTQQNGRILRFLLADSSGGLTESDVGRRCADVLAKYSKPTWSFTSSTRDLSLPTGADAIQEEVEREIGVSPAVLREFQRKTIRLYVNTASAVCAAETRLEDKLKRLETISGRLNDLMFLEPTPALEGLTEPTRAYLDSVLEKIDLESDYRVLTENYKKFTMLKNLVSLTGFQRCPAPTCTICMTKEVSQAMTPCGHTFCEDCCRSQMTACYICRVQIRDKVRLFFS